VAAVPGVRTPSSPNGKASPSEWQPNTEDKGILRFYFVDATEAQLFELWEAHEKLY
jgi:hypothetical protein